MQAERQHREIQSRTIQPKREKLGGTPIVDNRNTVQTKLTTPIQRVGLFGEEEEAVQGKFVTQLQEDEELQMKPIVQLQSEDEDILQGKFDTIQQKQEHVQSTMQLQGINVNNETSLESEADIMGSKAMQIQ